MVDFNNDGKTIWMFCTNSGMSFDDSLELLLNGIAIVLSASVFGDHCSPISDTTIISSMASATDHIDHVRTQLPYALFVGALAALGYLIV